MDRVAGAGLSGAKEAHGFRASALHPRPPPQSISDTALGTIRKVRLVPVYRQRVAVSDFRQVAHWSHNGPFEIGNVMA